MSRKLKLKTLDNKIHEIEIDQDILISDLKQKIEEELKAEPSKQRIIYKGQQLKDTNKLSDYIQTDDQTLHVMVRSNPPPESTTTNTDESSTNNTNTGGFNFGPGMGAGLGGLGQNLFGGAGQAGGLNFGGIFQNLLNNPNSILEASTMLFSGGGPFQAGAGNNLFNVNRSSTNNNTSGTTNETTTNNNTTSTGAKQTTNEPTTTTSNDKEEGDKKMEEDDNLNNNIFRNENTSSNFNLTDFNRNLLKLRESSYYLGGNISENENYDNLSAKDLPESLIMFGSELSSISSNLINTGLLLQRKQNLNQDHINYLRNTFNALHSTSNEINKALGDLTSSEPPKEEETRNNFGGNTSMPQNIDVNFDFLGSSGNNSNPLQGILDSLQRNPESMQNMMNMVGSLFGGSSTSGSTGGSNTNPLGNILGMFGNMGGASTTGTTSEGGLNFGTGSTTNTGNITTIPSTTTNTTNVSENSDEELRRIMETDAKRIKENLADYQNVEFSENYQKTSKFN